jgi:hypothetical protein
MLKDSQGFHVRAIAIVNGIIISAEYIINKQRLPDEELKYINENYKELQSTEA